MSTLRLFAAVILASVVATPVLAQAVISEPGYCAQFYPTANCNNEVRATPTPIRTGVATEAAGAQSRRQTRPLALYGSGRPGIGRKPEAHALITHADRRLPARPRECSGPFFTDGADSIRE